MWLKPYGILLLGAGGAVGAILRYLVSGWVQARQGTAFPWGTLAVNVVGCLLIGVLTPLVSEKLVRPEYRTALLVGGLGAFTTFSTFGYETLSLLEGRQFRYALLYVIGTNGGCLTAVWLGHRVSEKLLT